MYDYMAEAHGNWLALPHSDQATKSALGERFGVRGIRKSFCVRKYFLVSEVIGMFSHASCSRCKWQRHNKGWAR